MQQDGENSTQFDERIALYYTALGHVQRLGHQDAGRRPEP